MEQSEENTGIAVEETIGDAAYGDGGTRQAFADAGRTLIAKVPGSSQKRPLPQGGLPDRPGGRRLHLPGRAGHPHPTHHGYPDQPVGPDLPGPEFSIRPEGLWRMPPAVPVRGGWRGQRPHGDTPSSRGAPATSRAFQKSEDFAEYRGRRQVVEHRLARLVQLGVRQSRYFGRAKTLFQLLLAATVANLTLVATKTGMMSQASGFSPNKPENRPDRPAAGACPEFATGSPIVTAQFILVAASWAALSLRPGPVRWLTSASSRHSRAFQPGF